MKRLQKLLALGLVVSNVLFAPYVGTEVYAGNTNALTEEESGQQNDYTEDIEAEELDAEEDIEAEDTEEIDAEEDIEAEDTEEIDAVEDIEARDEEEIGSAEDIEANSEEESNSSEVAGISNVEEEMDYILGRPMTEEEIQEQVAIIEEAQKHLGYVEDPNAPQNVKLSPGTSIVWGTLPRSYDSRDAGGKSYVTVAKNQNPYGTCWAFSSIACVESNMIRKSYYSNNAIDLSESHLAYFSNYSAPDVLGNDYKDQMYYQGTLGYLDQGGNTTMAYHALANWKGAVSEAYAPYGNVKEGFEQSSSVAYLQDIVHLQGFYYIDITDVVAIKNAIMEYGAVSVSYYAEHDYKYPYYNYNTAAYYYDKNYITTHAVTIIGWDDDYSKSNFKTQPDSDGAWLVKNSWGTDFGKNGYFWLSYEDKSVSQTVSVFDVEPADNYDNNYQYDFASGSGYYRTGNSSVQIASIFETKANNGKKESLKAVAVDLSYNANVKYSLQIYKNLTDLSDPTSGTALLSVPQTGETTLAGYYTIPLTREIVLESGDVFSVVFSLKTVSGDALYVLAEMSDSCGVVSVASSQEYQSYINWYGYWRDISANGVGNLRIKAFTDNMKETSVACSGVTIDRQNASIYVGKTLTLSASVLPNNATNKQVAWTSSDPRIATVDEKGSVTGVRAGTVTITVRTLNGNYTADCKVTVKAIPVGGYIGNINSELISFDLKKNDKGASYLTGEIVVVEWVDGKSTVPSATPIMTFRSTDGKEEIGVFVTPTGTNTYYFDRFIERLSPDKEYVFEIASGSEKNYSDNRSMNVNLNTSPKMVQLRNLGKIGSQKISYHKDAKTGELRLFQRNSQYEGWINSELKKTELVTGRNGNYVSGEIVVVEWEDGISTVPFETPIMYFKSTDGKESLPVFVTPTGTNTYYFDRSLGDMDTSKEYIFTITSGDKLNVSPNRSMTVTTAAMKNKSGTLWESTTQYVRYKTDPRTGELRIYAVNKK